MNDDTPIIAAGTSESELCRLHAEHAELKAMLRRLDMVVEATKAGYWDWDMRTGSVSVNAGWAEIFPSGFPFGVKPCNESNPLPDKSNPLPKPNRK
jgi:PAS domain-containing protein